MQELDPDDIRPPYMQVAEALRATIAAGDLPPGGKLPTHAELVSAYRVSLGTMKKALAVLQSDGLIISRRGEGAFVRIRAGEPAEMSRDDAASLREAISELAARLDKVEQRLGERP
jgi:DNA-binding GntR family transcriptional regulator